MKEVSNTVCEVFEVSKKQLEGSSRTEHLAWARMTYMYLCVELTGQPYSVIAKSVNRDRGCIYHAEKKIPDLFETHGGFRQLYWRSQDDLDIDRTELETPQPNHISA